MIPNEREVYLMHTVNEQNDKYWDLRQEIEDLRQEIEQEKKRRAILVMAGIAAAQKWDIDLTRVNVKIVNNLEPFKVTKPFPQSISAPLQKAVPFPPDDMFFFESYDKATHWACGDAQFWLAWGPVTNTLAIAILQNKDEIIGSIEFEY
jgi:hypothetical protein